MKVRILTRYMLVEYLSPLLLGILIFTFVLLLDKIFDFIDLFLNRGVHLATILKLLIYIFPGILTLSIPMGFLLGSLLTFGRLSEDGEITALRASGQHLFRIFWPPLAGAVLVSIILLYFNAQVTPAAHNAFRRLYRDVLRQNPLVNLEEKTFLEIKNLRLYVDSIDRRTDTLSGVHLYRLEDNAPPTRINSAEGHASVSEDRILFSLSDGTIQQMDASDPNRTTISSFDHYDISIPFRDRTGTKKKNIRSMNTPEISAKIADHRSRGIPATYLETEYHLRIAIACAPLAFCLIGSALGIKLQKGGKSIGFGLSLLVIFVYYLLLIGGITFSEKGYFLPWIDLWACNIITLSLGSALLFGILKR